MRHYILTALLIVNILTLNAQTPFDAYAPEHRDKVIIELQNDEPFRVENADTESKARYAEFDSETLCINILDSANNIIAVVVLEPDDKKFMTIDPLSDKYPSTSPYAYCANNPVMLIDPDGREVKTIFYKDKNELHVIDLDHYNSELPSKYVTCLDYNLEGIRNKSGELTHNQILVIENVFSGATSKNGNLISNGTKPLSNGTYDILDDHANTSYAGWFRLDKHDFIRYNDIDGTNFRSAFRLHLGEVSHGCVTIDKNKSNSSIAWKVLSSILNSTSTTMVKERRGKQWINPDSRLINYGTMEVK
ncbi:MAG: hypothetical protein R3Y59_09320 [bacterium]